MSKQGVTTAGGPAVKVYSCVLTPNREDRSRYVQLVSFEQGQDGRLHPVRRAYVWLVAEGGGQQQTERLVCVRVTALRWRDLAPQQAHVEMRDAWLAHVKAEKAKVRAIMAEQAAHVSEVQGGGA